MTCYTGTASSHLKIIKVGSPMKSYVCKKIPWKNCRLMLIWSQYSSALLFLFFLYKKLIWKSLTFCNWVRSSRPKVFCKKGVLRNFIKFAGKHLCQILRPATLLQKRLWHTCLTVNFVKFLRTTFLTEDLWWLLLPSGFYSKIYLEGLQ